MKKILIVLTLLFITGCDVKYDLTITDEKEVQENFVISVNNKFIENTEYSIDEFLDHYSYIYSSAEGFEDYNIETKKGSSDSYFIINNEYETLNDYVKSNSFISMFSYADIVDTGKYLTFTTSINQYLYNLKNDMVLLEDGDLGKVEINIKFYNEVVDHNADKVDKKRNIYTWYVDENEDIDKSYIHFKLGPKVKYLVKFMDIIKRNLMTIIVVASIMAIILFSVLFIMYKNKKNNEI